VLKNKLTFLVAIGALLLVGCAQPVKQDYSAYKAADPKTILILPPKNSSPEVDASYALYTRAITPVAEAGYYILPVTLVDEHFKANGLTLGDDIHQVDYRKLREVFKADAALYIHVLDYGTRYRVVSSASVVTAEATLLDLRTGQELWRGKATANSEEGKNNQGGLATLLITALVNQVVGTVSDQSFTVARTTATRLLSPSSPNSLLPGPRSPNYKTDASR
jgi:hypothetical protein